jgi:enterochelin esterase-like enzyme
MRPPPNSPLASPAQSISQMKRRILIPTVLAVLAVLAAAAPPAHAGSLPGLTITDNTIPQAAGERADNPPPWILPEVEVPRVQRLIFQSTAAKTKVSCFLYTPEIYDTETERRFPVLYWLHGTGGGAAGIAPLSAFFDRAIREGKIPPMLVVFPNGLAATMWCDSKDESVPMETVVVKELLPHIDASFRTIAKREGRIIEGFSMGGYGAARLGFKYPGLFAAVSILAGGPLDLEFKGPRATENPAGRERIFQKTFGGDIDYFRAQSPFTVAEENAVALRGKQLVRQAVGDRDFSATLNRDFSEHLKKLGIEHTFILVPGVGHKPLALLNALGESNWAFYQNAFGGLPMTPAPD